MVVIRINGNIEDEHAGKIKQTIHDQAKDGVIVLPWYCELLNEVPADEKIQVIPHTLADRVEQLEAELSAAMAYISAEKACVTCKHIPIPDRPGCVASDYTCQECDDQNCVCNLCDKNGSKWEWRGAYGR